MPEIVLTVSSEIVSTSACPIVGSPNNCWEGQQDGAGATFHIVNHLDKTCDSRVPELNTQMWFPEEIFGTTC